MAIEAGVTRDDEGRRQRVVLAAVEAIDEIGPAVGMGEIADRAGLQRPNVYRLFASKEQLDVEVAAFAANELVRRVRPTFRRSGTTREVIHGVVATAVAWAGEHPHLYRFLAAQQQTKALHRARTGRTRFLDEILRAMSAYLDGASLPPGIPDGVLAGLMGMVDAGILWWLDHRDETETEVVDRLTRQVELILTDLLAQHGIHVPTDAVVTPS